MGYEINGVEYSYYSGKNQHIIDMLISREVYCCMTSEMEYMLSKVWDGDRDNPFDYGDLDNLYSPVCYSCGSGYGFEEINPSELDDEDFDTDTCFYEDADVEKTTFLCPVCGAAYASVSEARECCSDKTVYKCIDCGQVYNESEYNSLSSEPKEIFEWWAVSNWFGEKLREQGCVVIESWGKSYWGRCTTGQAISLDGCVVHIAANMGILEGMEHEWRM